MRASERERESERNEVVSVCSMRVRVCARVQKDPVVDLAVEQ